MQKYSALKSEFLCFKFDIAFSTTIVSALKMYLVDFD